MAAYEWYMETQYPMLSKGAINDASHGALIAINSDHGLSTETIHVVTMLNIQPRNQDIINYVFEIEEKTKNVT